MAGGVTFHYWPGDSPLHRWDARCKVVALAIVTAGLLHVNAAALVLFSVLLVGMTAHSRLPWLTLARELRSWGIFLAIIFLVQALTQDGSEERLASWLPVTITGAQTGLLTCWRLALILTYAALFSLVTRPGDLQTAILWFLRPFPFLPARRIALMVALTLRFLPLILDQADDVRQAARSRLVHLRRNPFIRIKALVLPLMRRFLLRSGDLALALAARGYREDIALPAPPPVPAVHWAPVLGLFLLVFALMLDAPRIFQETLPLAAWAEAVRNAGRF